MWVLSFNSGEPVLEPIARSVNRNHLAMMEEAIEDRRGQYLVAEHASPFTEGLVGGQDDGTVLIAFRYDLEDEIRVRSIQWKVANLVNQQDRGPSVGAHLPIESSELVCGP